MNITFTSSAWIFHFFSSNNVFSYLPKVKLDICNQVCFYIDVKCPIIQNDKWIHPGANTLVWKDFHSNLTCTGALKRIIDNKHRKPTHPLALLKTHLERPAAVGERRTHWGSPWAGRSSDSWHRAPHVSPFVPCSGCSSPQTSVAPSTERPAAQTVFTAKQITFRKWELN